MRRSIVEENRKWRWSDIGVWMKNSVQAIIKGQFLMRLGFNKYFIHIIYTFFLFWVSIWLSLQIEKTLTKVEENQKRLDDMEIYHAQKVVELVGLNRLTTVRNLLHEKGSQVDIPQQPAVTIKKK
ncbi:MAG: hypothetical protein II552_02150 [Bacteroidales bacterium]|nr:hypothetical protein [Bacteroidales bacterium]MBQ4305541.1 hypothetical protein [Bacteroidales bacterium]